MERSDALATRRQARAIGAIYLLFFISAVAGAVLTAQAGVSGLQSGPTPAEAAGMADMLPAHQGALQVGFALTLLSTACYVAVTGLLYGLLRGVSERVALVAVLFSLLGLAVQTVGSVLQLAPMVVLGKGTYLTGFDAQQLRGLALLLLNLSAEFARAGLVFDGLWLLVLGYLIFQSRFLPRPLGVLIALAGLAWEAYLSPPLVTSLGVPIEVLGSISEAALMLWLLTVGVDTRRRGELPSARREANVTPR